jgi:hypothetical protein
MADPFLAADIDISQDARSIADPAVDLPVEMPKFDPKFEVTLSKEAIKGDEIDKVRVSLKLVATRKDGKMDAIREWGVTWTCPGAARADVTGPSGDWPLAKAGKSADAEFIADWAQQNRKLSIGMRVSYYPECIKEGYPAQDANGSIDLDVIGADPILVLEPEPQYALANGKALVKVRPCLIMFGEVYQKPMEIRDVEYDLDFLEATSLRPTNNVPTPEQQMDQWFLCRFHLDDSFMIRHAQEGGTKVSMSVKPLDSYARGVPAPGLKADTAAIIRLAPCTVTFEGPQPAELPSPIWWMPPAFPRPQPRHFQTKIRVRVVDAAGEGVTHELIQHGDRASSFLGDTAFWDGWGFQVTYTPPTTPKWRAEKDPHPGQAFVPSRNYSNRMHVADDGWIWFVNPEEGKPTDYFLYDHWATFYSDPIKYLRGQASTLFLEFQAGSVRFPPIQLPCGTMPGNSTLMVKTLTQCKKGLKDCTVTLKAGPRTETKTSKYPGETEFADVSTEHPVEITVDRRGEDLWIGRGEDPPQVRKSVELLEGPPTILEIEMELCQEWALTTMASMSWSVTNIPMIGKFAGKIVPVGALLVVGVLTNRSITDPAKVGETLAGPEIGKGNSKLITFFGVGLAPSIDLVDLINAIRIGPGAWKAFKDSVRSALQGAYATEEAKSISRIQQVMQYYRATSGADLLSKLAYSGFDICAPSATDFTTDVPVRSADFRGPGFMEQVEFSLTFAKSFGLAHFNAVPYSGIGISTSSWAVATIGISGGIWFGKWSLPMEPDAQGAAE